MASMTVNNIKKRNVIKYEGDICIVLDIAIRTPPNNASYCQMDLRSIKTGRTHHVRTNVGKSFDVLDNRFKDLEFSYENQGEYIFMDNQTFETHTLQKEMIEEIVDFLVPNNSYEVMFVEGNPILINLPASVEMTVTESPDAVRGNTASNVSKIVTLETGLQVSAPQFIKVGDKLKVSTKDKSYLGRA